MERLAYATLFRLTAALDGGPSAPAVIAVASITGKSSSAPSGLIAALKQWMIVNAVNRIHQTWKVACVPSNTGIHTERIATDSSLLLSAMLFHVLSISLRSVLEHSATRKK